MFEHRAHRRPRGPEDRAEHFSRHRGHGPAGQWGRWGAFAGMFAGRGPMVRRGDVRTAILALLAEQPMHGYQVIQELGERSRGAWRPSAGSIYPTLQQLEDEGLVRPEERDGRRVFSLTEAGREQAEQVAGGRGRPWDLGAEEDTGDLRRLVAEVAAAAVQVSRVATPETAARARQILVETRRGLYRLLAEDDIAETGAAGTIDPNE